MVGGDATPFSHLTVAAAARTSPGAVKGASGHVGLRVSLLELLITLWVPRQFSRW